MKINLQLVFTWGVNYYCQLLECVAIVLIANCILVYIELIYTSFVYIPVNDL